MKNISQADLTAHLMSVKGARFATITTETVPDMHKRNNTLAGRVTKRSTVNVTMGANYKNSTQRAMKKLGFSKAAADNVTIEPRKWGTHVPGTSFVKHGDHMYLVAKLNAKPQKVAYFVDGEAATVAQLREINAFLVPKKPNAVPTINVNMNNVREVKIDKQHFVVS